MRVADLVVETLNDLGVREVFTVTGRGSLFITDALARQHQVRVIANHHEQASAYAACALSALSNQLTVCIVSTGCGAVNALGGALTAWQDELPVLFISGQNFSTETAIGIDRRFRTYGEQETDIVSMVSTVTKLAIQLTDSKDCESIIRQAASLAMRDRRGPVWIDIPLDVQSATAQRSLSDSRPSSNDDSSQTGTIPTTEISELARMIETSQRPILLVGARLRYLNAIDKLSSLAETHEIPIVFDGSAVDVFGSGNRLSIGSVGAQGCSRAGNFALQNADLVVAIGSWMRTSLVGEDSKSFVDRAKLVLVDSDIQEVRTDRRLPDKVLVVDLPTFFDELVCELKVVDRAEWLQHCSRWKSLFDEFPVCHEDGGQSEGVDLHDVARAIERVMPDSGIFVTDSGLAQLILPTNIKFRATQRCIQPFSQGAMGYALPAAIGAVLSADSHVLAVTGDGSIMMNLQELQTISYHQMPVIIIVVTNGMYAVIRKRQSELFRGRTIATDETNGLSSPDFELIASSFKIRYRRATTSESLEFCISDAYNKEGPTLIELAGRPDQDYVRAGRFRDPTGMIRPTRLENQLPLLPRDLIEREMLQ